MNKYNRINHGTTTGQPRDNHGTNGGTTTGQPRDNHGTTTGQPAGQPRDNPGHVLDGGGQHDSWPRRPLATGANRRDSRSPTQLRLASPARSHARTKRNDFPVGLNPPTSNTCLRGCALLPPASLSEGSFPENRQRSAHVVRHSHVYVPPHERRGFAPTSHTVQFQRLLTMSDVLMDNR